MKVGKAGLLFAALVMLVAGCRSPDDVVFEREAHWPRRTAYPGVGQGRIVVTSSGDDTLTLFDLAELDGPALTPLARVPVGLVPVELEGPHHAAISPEGQSEFFYVGISNFVPGGGSGPHGAHGTGTVPGHALKLRASDNAQVASVRVERNPGDLVLSLDGKTLFLSHYDLLKINEALRQGSPASEMDSRLAVIDTETMTRKALLPLCPAAHGLKLGKDGTRLYASCHSDELAIVRLDDPALPVARVKVAANAGDAVSPLHEPYALALTPDGLGVYVSALKSKQLLYLDVALGQMDPSRAIALAGSPYFGDFSSDGTRFYLPLQGPDILAVVDPATSTVLTEEPLRPHGCTNVHQVFNVQPDRALLVVCEGNHLEPGVLLVLNLPGLTLRKKAAVGVFPDYVGILK